MGEKSIIRRIAYGMNPRHIDKKMVKLWTFWIIFNVILFCIPKGMIQNSIWILVPLAGLFIYALVTKDVIQSMLMGTFSMYILWYKLGAVGGFFKDLLVVLSDEENIIMYMSFFLCGGIIIALKRSGSTKAFSDFITSKFGKSEKLILSTSGIYAGIMSIDDYVSALTAGASFSPLIDVIKKPRVALAYVIRTFSICVSAMLPFGAWGYFIIFQIAGAKNIGSRAQATTLFLHSVPFMFYAIVACVLALLFSMGLIPKIGPMKKAYEMIKKEGKQMGDLTDGSDEEEKDFDDEDPRKQNVSVLNLVIPMVVIVTALIATGLDCFLAFGIAALVTGVLYILQGIFTIGEYVQCIVDGFIDMVDMVIILMIGYTMQEVMYAMGMEGFVKAVCGAVPIVSLLPVLFFVFFSCSEYLYSLNYTLYQIAIPVLLVVLPGLGANIPLCLGAVISAGLFGANACVVSDLGVISARACRVKIYDQYRTSQPYVLIAGVISAILYLVVGIAIG
ncbi:MAG: Na+/H+ antiporter NhaC family protein [Anaerostipes sp.]|nr:Na+/H+ antiporter NhaC family protein [Anaerostipes sp.]MDD3745649.1 Na+/H+ antiporter NhaC family protein [Anaerostipes sp.]